MEWQYLKNKLYFVDGSLRDIYVKDVSREDWEKWINFVNENYEVEFNYFDVSKILIRSNKIIPLMVYKYWDGSIDTTLNATVKVGDISFKCYFFYEGEIENDISPDEVNNIENHNDIVNYLKAIAFILNKEIIMTIENYSTEYEEVLMKINNSRTIIS